MSDLDKLYAAVVGITLVCLVMLALSACVAPRNMRCTFDWETGVINCHPVEQEIPAEPRSLSEG